MAQGPLGPQIPTDPMELLTNQFLIEEPLLAKHWGAGLLGCMAFAGICCGNWFTSRPMFVGIQKHIVFTGLATAVGHYIDESRRGYFAERDAVYRHYVQLHQEDFPAPERKKFSEVLQEWWPIR